MSYEILYQRVAIKVDDERYILMFQAGSNNCFEFVNGREVAEKNWFAYLPEYKNKEENRYRDVYLKFSEMDKLEQDLMRFHDTYSNENSEWANIFKSRYTCWKIKELIRSIKNAVKKPVTVEELKEANEILYVYGYFKPKNADGKYDTESNDYDYSSYTQHYPVSTTQELIDTIEWLSKDDTIGKIGLTFYTRDKLKFRKNTKRTKKTPELVTEYYVLKKENESSYFVKSSRAGDYYSRYPDGVKAFKTEKDAMKFLNKKKSKNANFKFTEIKYISRGRAYI